LADSIHPVNSILENQAISAADKLRTGVDMRHAEGTNAAPDGEKPAGGSERKPVDRGAM